MKIFRTAVLAVTLAFVAFSQESTQAKQAEEAEPSAVLMWVNFAILVFGLGYLVSKSAPAIFRAREEQIRGGIEQAARKKKEADDRASEIDRKLAGFGGEIEKLRQGVGTEMSMEAERIRQETVKLVRRIEEQAQQEIGFLTKAARQELKKHSADLALDLAQQKVKQQMNPETQHELVSEFITGLRRA
ncbi:MAG: ATP synthase F0 subunit B [Acidobacteriota bacterium]|nr:ATP synthase F0 subunit B [Acidobacteriota bacterium]